MSSVTVFDVTVLTDSSEEFMVSCDPENVAIWDQETPKVETWLRV